MTITTLESIKKEIASLIGERFYLTTDQQSFDRYPTNHVNLIIDDCSIEVGTIIYDEIMKDCEIIQYLPLILWSFEFHKAEGQTLSIGLTSDLKYNVTIEDEPHEHTGEIDLLEGWADTADQIDKVLIGLLCQ